MPRFHGKTVLVTGSGTGIGRAIAKRFAGEGASVIILGRRPGPLEEAAGMLREVIEEAGSGASVTVFSGVDVADEEAVTKMFDSLAEAGVAVDVAVNNAGVSGPVTCFVNSEMRDFRSTVGIHLTGTFWVSREALRVMKSGSKIITISTFFTEERPLEQRPYRFRDPYTASQGAKNRLAEAMSWELQERGIISIATNPGPVHSDRIYKTVYPKAAAEFMRVGGFEGMEPALVEAAAKDLVQLLGEDPDVVREGISSAAGKIAAETGDDPDAAAETLRRLLEKIQRVAEKIQKNTAGMISDGQFLSQEQVAETVLTLAGDEMARILNGKVIPGDRVFYPVRSHVANAAPAVAPADYAGKTVIFAVDARSERDARRAAHLAARVEEKGGAAVCLVSKEAPVDIAESISSKFHSHACDLGDPAEVERWMNAASQRGEVLAVVHLTGDVPDAALTGLSRKEWDALVERFVHSPATVVQRSLEHFIPGGGRDPRLYEGASGRVVVVGPALPEGRKASGAQRARVEVFRGALRPFVTTVNQELSDVLRSEARVFAAFPGAVDGREPDDEKIALALDYFVSPGAPQSGEIAFCIDEAR